MTAQITTPKALALELDTTARTLRKFLRSTASPVSPVGKGHRYALDAKTVKAIKKGFIAWNATNTPDAADTAPTA